MTRIEIEHKTKTVYFNKKFNINNTRLYFDIVDALIRFVGFKESLGYRFVFKDRTFVNLPEFASLNCKILRRQLYELQACILEEDLTVWNDLVQNSEAKDD